MEDYAARPREEQADAAAQAGKARVPLVLDIDGTLLRTDLLHETLWAAIGRNLLATLAILLTCWMAPARLKRRLRRIGEP